MVRRLRSARRPRKVESPLPLVPVAEGDKVNAYFCATEPCCGFHFTSRDVDQGVTPFLMPCRCGGQAQSLFYRASGHLFEHGIDIEWYAPDNAEKLRLTGPSFEHVRQGGLLFRVVNPRCRFLEASRLRAYVQ